MGSSVAITHRERCLPTPVSTEDEGRKASLLQAHTRKMGKSQELDDAKFGGRMGDGGWRAKGSLGPAPGHVLPGGRGIPAGGARPSTHAWTAAVSPAAEPETRCVRHLASQPRPPDAEGKIPALRPRCLGSPPCARREHEWSRPREGQRHGPQPQRRGRSRAHRGAALALALALALGV